MIEVDIVTPLKKVVEGARVPSVKLPSELGELEILPGHAALLTLLGTGEMAFLVDGQQRRFAVSFGFAAVKNDKVTVMAEAVEEAREIDRGRAKKAQQQAEQALLGVMTPEEFKKNKLKLQRALTRQRVSGA